MRKTRSIGHGIEWWWQVNEVQISGTKNALYRAFLDSLTLMSCPVNYEDKEAKKKTEEIGSRPTEFFPEFI
jgi:hypothetical protein